MAAKHGSRRRYIDGCRCDDCGAANKLYQQQWRQRRANGETSQPAAVLQLTQAPSEEHGPGPVEAAVQVEIEGLQQTLDRPGLAQTALAMARILDDPRARSQQPAAAANLANLLDKLRKGADARKSKLAGVRAMTSAKSATG